MKNTIYKKKLVSSTNDLDVTPFLSLMVVLIPVLLLMVKFNLLGEYDMNTSFPSSKESLNNSLSVNELKNYKLIIRKNIIILKQDNTDKPIISSHNSLESKLDDEFNKLDIHSISLHLQIETKYSYQDMVKLLDIINMYKDKLNSLSISTKSVV
ncbi:biopolymer transporter ExbD [Aliivibrio fischeri]|uniref:biopolymer transporter ExbD n=1 Tax=Aliivibrio fischeri TaxID=668 RepID=UPI00084CD893|nr:biopolymer transporter ExbD [Aliivibrio fischeri]MUJ27994.1 hypothetical protein [Aliivibrio fischeri]OED52795.1 hypothetical protein BEI47_18900 [Aliivibrio fischeri]